MNGHVLGIYKMLEAAGLSRAEAERLVSPTDYQRAFNLEVDHLQTTVRQGRRGIGYRAAADQAAACIYKGVDDALGDQQVVTATWALNGLLIYRPGMFYGLLVGARAVEMLRVRKSTGSG